MEGRTSLVTQSWKGLASALSLRIAMKYSPASEMQVMFDVPLPGIRIPPTTSEGSRYLMWWEALEDFRFRPRQAQTSLATNHGFPSIVTTRIAEVLKLKSLDVVAALGLCFVGFFNYG